MAHAVKKNAIERRLEYLSSLWNEFAKATEPRLLRWCVDGDEARMVELLFEAQNEETGDIPDLFIVLGTPFDDPFAYGLQLQDELRQQYEDSREALMQEGLGVDWQCPPPGPGASNVHAFVRTCVSFHDYYADKMLVLALALIPEHISDPVAWQAWLRDCIQSGLPPTIRLTVIDRLETPLLDALAAAEPRLMQTVEPDLDMAGAIEELAQQTEGVGPGNDFRRLFVALTNAAAQGKMKLAKTKAAAALKIAQKHHWFDLQVAVYMALGAAQLEAGTIRDALLTYRQAGQVAQQAEQTKHPAGAKLLLQTRLAEAAALISDADYPQAAAVYEASAPLALAIDDPMLVMESWRMAAYCHEMSGQVQESWRCGNLALQAAERLDEDQRRHSTLPYAGQGLLRLLSRHQPDRRLEQEVRDRLVALVGPDWKAQLETGGRAE